MTRLLPAVLSALLLNAGGASAGEWPAQLEWSGRATLAFPVSGVIDQVAVEPGQQVKKGELLAVLHPAHFKASVAEAAAEVARLGEEVADAKRDLDRVKELYARTVSATTELDASQLRHARAAATLAGAQARLERARRQLEESELRAPADGVILSRMIEPGMVAASACQPTPALVLARTGEMRAVAQIEAAHAAALRLGDAVEVISKGQTVAAKVRAVSPAQGGKFRVEAQVPPTTAGWRAGQSVTLRLP